MDMSDLKTLANQVINFREARSWKRFHGSKDLILGLLVELGELAEHFQYLTGEELEKYQRDFKEDIGEEMADVLFWILLMSAEQGIDLEQAFLQKMKKNAKKYPIAGIDEKTGLNKSGKLYNRWHAKNKGQ